MLRKQRRHTVLAVLPNGAPAAGQLLDPVVGIDAAGVGVAAGAEEHEHVGGAEKG
jgi:hypothetical protein